MTDNIRRVFLVDYENTSIRGLYGISCLTGNAKVVVFCSTPVIQRAVEDVLYAYKQQGIEIGTFILIKQGKNALDFMISTYLGYEVNAKIDKEIYIISGDHGYGSAVEMAKQLDSRMMIGSGRNIFECLPGYMRQGRFDIEDPNDFALPAEAELPKLPPAREDSRTGLAYPVADAHRPKRERRSIFSAFRKKKPAEPVPAPAEPVEAVHVDELPPQAKMPARKKTPKVVVEVIDLEDLQVPTRVVGHKVSEGKQAEAAVATKKEKTKVAVAEPSVKPEKAKPEKTEKVKPEKPPKLSRAEKAKLAKAEKEKAEREKAERERAERERAERERLEREKAERERLAKEKAAKPEKPARTAGRTLTKREKQELRNNIEQYMVQDGIIPEKFHLGVSSAIANAKDETECSEGVKIALGRFYPQYIETILRYYHKYRK